ncbi:hypothetical protein PHSY_006332 [Pseudozyma hubeiensis SY62]|uniref:Uncharacterized protein n=1 Tax=Pseudozyma hubeiensis (strain SY62) TaxID=1305764 RepID=R9PBF3_PSEHS|nr:hypothetical protein PHSY_006332 [Pseudozyma hubeiensis SY62]GAC98738.1 hypothetical protein PHSY_006332 [Pseudozyma hubeiensis SY62]
MSAARMLQAGPSRLAPALSISLRSTCPSRCSALHTTAVRWRRESPTHGPRSSLRASAVSSPSTRTSIPATPSASTPATTSPPPRSTSSTPVASSSGIPRHQQAKVEVIPFRVPTKAAKDYLTTLATTEVMPRVMSRWSMIKHQFLSLIGIKSLSEPDGNIVKLERMTALYLPTWVVDASFEIKCRGNDGRAEANFITTSSRFPGHSWKPMDSIPMIPPPPHDMMPTMGKDPEYAAHTPKDAWDNLAMADYESYESHQKRKAESKVQIKGGIPDPLPFTISPLCLPDMIRRQLELKDVTFTPDLAAGIELPGGGVHGLGLTIALVNEEGEQITAPPVRFEPETLKLDMMAAYPILMPLHMAEFSYADQETGDRHFITMVLGAWDTNGLQFCMKEKDEDWQWSFLKTEPLKVDLLDMYPRTPIKTTLNEMFERARKEEREERRKAYAQEMKDAEAEEGASKKSRKTREEWEAELDKEDAENQKAFRSDLRSRMMEKLRSELPIKVAVEQRSLEMLQRADWIHWERDEREAFETRTSPTIPPIASMTPTEKDRHERTKLLAATSPTEPRPFQRLANEQERKAELNHPDRKAGLGRYIHWTSPHVQRLSHNVYANRRYLTETIPAVLNSRKMMASIQENGYDVDRSLTKAKLEDGRSVSGEEAWKTIAADDLSVRQQREKLKPRWLKALEEAGR